MRISRIVGVNIVIRFVGTIEAALLNIVVWPRFAAEALPGRSRTVDVGGGRTIRLPAAAAAEGGLGLV